MYFLHSRFWGRHSGLNTYYSSLPLCFGAGWWSSLPGGGAVAQAGCLSTACFYNGFCFLEMQPLCPWSGCSQLLGKEVLSLFCMCYRNKSFFLQKTCFGAGVIPRNCVLCFFSCLKNNFKSTEEQVSLSDISFHRTERSIQCLKQQCSMLPRC